VVGIEVALCFVEHLVTPGWFVPGRQAEKPVGTEALTGFMQEAGNAILADAGVCGCCQGGASGAQMEAFVLNADIDGTAVGTLEQR